MLCLIHFNFYNAYIFTGKWYFGLIWTFDQELLLLLSHFSRVWLCVTPQTAAHQAPPSLGFSRQEHWSGLPCLLQCMKVKSESEVAQSCLTLSNPMDCSLPGSSFHGIFQARVLEWFAIAFSWSRTTSNQILFLWLFLYALNQKVSLWYINHILHSKEINTILVKKKIWENSYSWRETIMVK